MIKKIEKVYLGKLNIKQKKNELNKIKSILLNSRSLEYSNQQLKKFTNKAIDSLDIFNDSPEKSALIELLNFNLERKY